MNLPTNNDDKERPAEAPLASLFVRIYTKDWKGKPEIASNRKIPKPKLWD
ncbi:hypothetical protein GO491_02650 [Flavobacteriaceae bacterium Ap0902]|nr:hypothetical protein [Flavobacteriaceae bacterium Ap0902]